MVETMDGLCPGDLHAEEGAESDRGRGARVAKRHAGKLKRRSTRARVLGPTRMFGIDQFTAIINPKGGRNPRHPCGGEEQVVWRRGGIRNGIGVT